MSKVLNCLRCGVNTEFVMGCEVLPRRRCGGPYLRLLVELQSSCSGPSFDNRHAGNRAILCLLGLFMDRPQRDVVHIDAMKKVRDLRQPVAEGPSHHRQAVDGSRASRGDATQSLSNLRVHLQHAIRYSVWKPCTKQKESQLLVTHPLVGFAKIAMCTLTALPLTARKVELHGKLSHGAMNIYSLSAT
eukprot:2563836-Amphidinium_carterae.1